MRRGLFAGTPVVTAVVAAVLALITPASAQSYPDRSVRIIIAFAAGGTIDTLGRILVQKLTEAWGQNVVVENRPGGGGNIGAAAAAKSAPDGYTIHFGAQTVGVLCGFGEESELRARGADDILEITAQLAEFLLKDESNSE